MALRTLVAHARTFALAVPLSAAACGSDNAPAAATDNDSASGQPTGATAEPARLQGFADLHLHMFAAEAFGGGWLHGSAQGTAELALATCDGGTPGDHARLQEDLSVVFDGCDPALIDEAVANAPLLQSVLAFGGGTVSELIASIPGSEGDTGEHARRRGGWPELDGWPRWDTIAHQQSWHGWLKQAHDAGLRVTVMSAVSLDWLCKALPAENRTRPQCDEMADVVRQLELANEFAAANDWVEIALSPEHARELVAQGKLAMVLSIETSHLFGTTGDWRSQLDQVYGLGVRTLQIVHQLDNRFGGAAPHNEIFQLAMFNESCHIDYDCALTGPEATLGFDVDTACRNVLGITEQGRELVAEMMNRDMLIDVAHMSERLTEDVFELAKERDFYPIYASHAHFREIMVPDKAQEEKTTPSWAVAMIRQSGGMVGLRTAHEAVGSYGPSAVANSCHGSTRSFAQAYDYGQKGLKVAIGLGSDFNGFIQQTRPRFGDDGCSAGFAEEAQCQVRDERTTGVAGVNTQFDTWGLAHVGMLGDLIDDLEALGSDVDPLRHSANDFVRMWERASDTNRSGPASAADDIDVGGITHDPSVAERRDALPTECDKPYCAAALHSGQACRFDAECEGGSCVGAGTCGTPRGECS